MKLNLTRTCRGPLQVLPCTCRPKRLSHTSSVLQLPLPSHGSLSRLPGFPRPNGPFGHPSTLPPSTASPRPSLLDLAGSFDAPGPPLDRGRVSAVGRRSPRSRRRCRWRARFPQPTGPRFPPGPDFRAPMRCLQQRLAREGGSGARGRLWPIGSSCGRGRGGISVPAARVMVRLGPSLTHPHPSPFHGR